MVYFLHILRLEFSKELIRNVGNNDHEYEYYDNLEGVGFAQIRAAAMLPWSQNFAQWLPMSLGSQYGT